MFLVVYVSKPRDREMESCRDLLGIKLGFKDLDQEHRIHKNLLEDSSRILHQLGIFSAQKERKEREISMDSRAYMCSRLMEKVLEHFLLAWSSLEISKMWRNDEDPREKMCVCSWCFAWCGFDLGERKREWDHEREREGEICGDLMGYL